MTSFTEENYLKTIYHLGESKDNNTVNTNELAESTQTKAASVTDMIRRLSEKKLVNYKKYQGVSLTDEGKAIALKIIRKHRLWEVFLVEKLGFKWDEIHEIAEQLEHIDSVELTNRLDFFLGNPKFDPHGDPIPNAQGEMPTQLVIKLSDAPTNTLVQLMNVSEDSPAFLQHLDKLTIKLGSKMKIIDKSDFDDSITVTINGSQVYLSHKVALNLLVAIP